MYPIVPAKLQNPYASYYPYAHKTNNTKDYRMELQGIGIVKAEPDRAIVTLSVVTENKELKIAQEENAENVNDMLDALEKIGITKDDVETVAYNINLQYDYIDGEKVFRGYRVENTIKITIRDLEKTGETIDTAVSNGANEVNNIYFTVSDPSIYYRQALMNAIENAIEKAEDIEKQLGVVVNKIPIKILEETYHTAPLRKQPLLETPSTITPIKPGRVEITASVKAVFAYKG